MFAVTILVRMFDIRGSHLTDFMANVSVVYYNILTTCSLLSGNLKEIYRFLRRQVSWRPQFK